MRPVVASELLDLGAYEAVRDRFVDRMVRDKRARRVRVSDETSAVFENHDTVLFQVQEMVRAERITADAAIAHELETYNELVPAPFELSATMFVEIVDKEPRDRRLVELAGLEGHIALDVLGTRVRGRNESRGVLPDRTTAVHYVKFPLGEALAARRVAAARQGAAEVAFVLDHPRLSVSTPLPAAVVQSLVGDLA